MLWSRPSAKKHLFRVPRLVHSTKDWQRGHWCYLYRVSSRQLLGKEAPFIECHLAALGTEAVVGAHWSLICRVSGQHSLGKGSLFVESWWALDKVSFTVTCRREPVTVTFICRAPDGILNKEVVIDVLFTETSWLRVTLGKIFVKNFIAFDECMKHSIKQLCPVVMHARILL